jgi:hypothetical protein
MTDKREDIKESQRQFVQQCIQPSSSNSLESHAEKITPKIIKDKSNNTKRLI